MHSSRAAECVHSVTAQTSSLAGAPARGHGPETLPGVGKSIPSGDRGGDTPRPVPGPVSQLWFGSCNFEINKKPTGFQSCRIRESGCGMSRGQSRHGRCVSPAARGDPDLQGKGTGGGGSVCPGTPVPCTGGFVCPRWVSVPQESLCALRHPFYVPQEGLCAPRRVSVPQDTHPLCRRVQPALLGALGASLTQERCSSSFPSPACVQREGGG